MGRKFSPGNADALGIKFHFIAVAFAKQIQHQRVETLRGQRFAALDALMNL